MSPLEAPPRPTAWHRSDHAAPDPALLGQSLPEALEALATARPEAVALIHDGAETSFAGLWQLVQGLAAEIVACQAPPGPVALGLGPGPLAVASWFACALAGRPFVMLEPANPPERNRMLIEKAGAAILLDQGLPPEGLAPAGLQIARLVPSGRAGAATGPALDPDAPAMIFPTSGSTGEPKLITYAARTLQVKLRASQELMRVKPGDRVLIAGSHANYGFLHHALVFLLAGGSLCLIDVKAAGLPGLFAAILNQGVRHVRFTPSLFRLAAARPEGRQALAALQGLRFSGEPLLTADLDLARGIVSPQALIQNVYGSTESALFLWTDDRARDLAPGTVPIGRIYPLAAFRLQDETGAAADEGELIIRSRHHALGDWQGGTVDASRFPRGPAGKGRLYATGDIVRMETSGDLVVLGRRDRVVKVNGQRVSLDEIESHLAALPGVDQAALVVQEVARGNPLVAFLVGDETATPGPALARHLPRHMIPGAFHWRAALPLLPGGKTDRKALLASLEAKVAPRAAMPVHPPEASLAPRAPAPDADIPPHPPGLSLPPTPPARDLAAIFAGLLKLPSVGPDADFFSLGGDSLLLMDLQLEVEARFGIRFDPRAFIPRATLRNLARLIGQPLAAPATVDRAAGVELTFRKLRDGASGVALIPPGLVGGAAAETWEASGALLDHALWACDAAFARGRTVDGTNWQLVIAALGRAIVTGRAPEPKVMAGYSVAGYLAWAAAQDLPAGLAPAVAMLDSWPLHRLARFQTPDWAPGRHPVGVRTLLLACDSPPGLRLPNSFKRRWSAQDEPIHRLVLPTLDHIEIGKPEVMTAAAGLLAAFARGGALPPVPATLPTMGGRILDLWQRDKGPPRAEVDALLDDRALLRGNDARMALLYLAVLRATPALARTLADELAAVAPDTPLFQAAPAILAALPRRAPPVGLRRLAPHHPVAATAEQVLERAVALRAASA